MQIRGKFTLMDLTEFESYIKTLNTGGLRKINHIQEHHTLSPSYHDFNGTNHFAKLEGMEAYHISVGFGQIAQHYTTFPDGKIAVCRNLLSLPTCIHRHNTGGICIENLGNFDTGADKMTELQKDIIIHLTALLCIKFNLKVNTDSIVYHHWFRQSDGFRDNANGQAVMADHKTCPGTDFFGGNTVNAAKTSFIPQVQKAYELYHVVPAGNPRVVNAMVKADVLNVRSGPGSSFNIVGKLHREEKISVFETQDSWSRIGDDRWVKSDYIDEINV